MSTERRFSIQPVPEAFVRRVRTVLTDDFNRTVAIVRANGGEPLRDKLRRADSGEPIILCSFQAVPLPSAFAEIGPIFISAVGCPSPPHADELPPGYFTRSFVVRAYSHTNEILESALIEPPHAIDAIRHLLNVPNVDCLHARFVGHGCFAAKIVRQ